MPSPEARAIDQWVKDRAEDKRGYKLQAEAEMVEEKYDYPYECMLKAFDYFYRNVKPGFLDSLIITINPTIKKDQDGFDLQILHYYHGLPAGGETNG